MKRGTLGGGAKVGTVITPEAPQTTPEPARPSRAKTREGKRNVTTYLDKAAHRQLAQLSLDREVSLQDLQREALNLLFEKHGLPRIA